MRSYEKQLSRGLMQSILSTLQQVVVFLGCSFRTCSQCHLESFIVGYAGSKLCSWRSTDDLQNFLETSKELNDFVTLHDSAYVTPPSFRFTIHRGTQLQPLFCFSALTHVVIAGISAEVQVQFVPKVEQRCKESACISYANLRVQVTQGAIRSIKNSVKWGTQ